MTNYGKSWESLNPETILNIFTEDATYQETPFKEPFRGHEEIKKYWIEVVIAKEKHVKFRLGKLFVYNNFGLAEWSSEFIRNDNGEMEELKGIIIAEVVNGKIKNLREYWHKQINSVS